LNQSNKFLVWNFGKSWHCRFLSRSRECVLWMLSAWLWWCHRCDFVLSLQVSSGIKSNHLHYCVLEMGPDPTWAYFWPAVNKRATRLQPEYFLTRPEEIFFKGQTIEKFDIFRGNFPNSNPNHKWLTRPDPSHKKLTRSGSKFFDPDPSLLCASYEK